MTGEGMEDLWKALKEYKSTKPRIEQDKNWAMCHVEQLLVEKFRQFCERKAEFKTEIDEGTLDEFIKDWDNK